MVDLYITEPVQKPTDWVDGFAVVEKPNRKLRVCLDPGSLNKVIKLENLHFPTAEEIFSQMSVFFKTRRQFRLLSSESRQAKFKFTSIWYSLW